MPAELVTAKTAEVYNTAFERAEAGFAEMASVEAAPADAADAGAVSAGIVSVGSASAEAEAASLEAAPAEIVFVGVTSAGVAFAPAASTGTASAGAVEAWAVSGLPAYVGAEAGGCLSAEGTCADWEAAGVVAAYAEVVSAEADSSRAAGELGPACASAESTN